MYSGVGLTYHVLGTKEHCTFVLSILWEFLTMAAARKGVVSPRPCVKMYLGPTLMTGVLP